MPPETDPDSHSDNEQLRNERALLCELLAAHPDALALFLGRAVRRAERIRRLLQRRAREPDEFTNKVRSLAFHHRRLAAQARAVPLSSVAEMYENCGATLQVVASSDAPTGDALLPALALIEEGMQALSMIAVHTGIPYVGNRRTRRPRTPRVGPAPVSGAVIESAGAAPIAATRSTAVPSAPPLVLALQQLAARLADEQGKRVELALLGMEHAPKDLYGALYDILAQLLRNAIEHGVELPECRIENGKSAVGTLLAEFALHGDQAELVFQDDGQGLQADRILQAGVARGLVDHEALPSHSPRLASSLIFHAEISTAADPTGRGQGMGIVRNHVKRMGGRIQVATKRAQFTRIRIRLPVAVEQTPQSVRHA